MTTTALKSLDDLPKVPFGEVDGIDTYAVLKSLREQAPLARTDVGITLALRNRHVELVTSDATRQIETETKMMQGIFDGPIFEFTRLAMLFANGETHMRRRLPVARTFAFKLMEAMRPRIRSIAEDMVRTHLNEGPIDFVENIASMMPARIIAEIMGIPEADIPVFRQWIEDTAAAIGMIDMDKREKIETSLAEFMAYVSDLLETRRQAPQEDFLSDYVAATAAAGNLDEGEIRTQILGLILAGSDTTRGSMCMILSEMLQRPDQWADFAADPDGLKKSVMEEGLRYQPVISAIPRVATRDLEIDGYRVPEGAVIAISTPSILRDPDIFEDPETFNIHRTDHQKWHFVFGAGAHRCVGEALAKAELEEILSAIVRIAPKTELIGPPPSLSFGAIRPVSAMSVAFKDEAG